MGGLFRLMRPMMEGILHSNRVEARKANIYARLAPTLIK